MTVITDGSHSVPTRVSISVDGGEPVAVDLAEVGLGEGNERGSTSGLALGTGPLRGTTFSITIDEVTEAASKDWFGGSRTVLPVGIAEIGLPVVAPPPDSTPLDAGCRDDLLAVTDAEQVGGTSAEPAGDAAPVPVRLVGTVGAATSGGQLRIETCGDPLVLAEGRTLLSSGDGRRTGFDVDMVTFSSAAGGAAGPDTLVDPPGPGPEPPATVVERTGRLDWRAEVTGATEPYWVVLGQSNGPGWRATTSNGVDLGSSTLINGYANGWRIDPGELGADVTVDITWTPQRFVWIGLGASAIGVLICLVLALRRPRSRSPVTSAAVGSVSDTPLPMRPVPVGPGHVDGPVWPPSRALLLAAATGAVAFVAGGPQIGVLVAVAVAVGLAVPRGQVLARAGSVVLLGAAAGYIVVQQYRNDFQVDFNWVEWFERSHLWGVGATLLLAAAVVVDGLRARSSRRSGTGPATGSRGGARSGGRPELIGQPGGVCVERRSGEVQAVGTVGVRGGRTGVHPGLDVDRRNAESLGGLCQVGPPRRHPVRVAGTSGAHAVAVERARGNGAAGAPRPPGRPGNPATGSPRPSAPGATRRPVAS